MKKLTVNASTSYDIFIGNDILKDCASYITPVIKPCETVIISDSTVDALYGDIVETSLSQAGYTVSRFTFEPGESSKDMNTVISALNFMSDKKITRGGLVVALGGGITGDVAGFISAIYLRGIPFAQIPTTFLAAVDSSVGGKTGVNLNDAKNQVGAFHQPALVICDPDTFKTLPSETFKDGVCEAIKYGMINDPELLKELAVPYEDNLESIIFRCVSSKKFFVENDEFDTGLRMLLNLGHTLGHAIEKLSDFNISHGHAVAIGMKLITRAGEKLGITKEPCLGTLLKLYEFNKIDTVLPSYISAQAIFDAACADKKISGKSLSLIVPEYLGKSIIHKIPVSELLNFIENGIE